MSQNNLRLAAFFSDTEVFHPIQHRHDMWRQDPFDVETIHKEARAAFERLLLRATTPPRPESGRILLLLGDSGCGKTHLLRAFRSKAHERSLGFVGYMQMTTAQSSYGRYMLNNLVDSLDQPYLAPSEPRSGLERISRMLLGRCSKVAELLAAPELDADEVPELVNSAADELKGQPLFEKCDLDLMRALLFLQRNDPRHQEPGAQVSALRGPVRDRPEGARRVDRAPYPRPSSAGDRGASGAARRGTGPLARAVRGPARRLQRLRGAAGASLPPGHDRTLRSGRPRPLVDHRHQLPA